MGDAGLQGVLQRPPAVLNPDRATFSAALSAATRSLSLAHAHETNTSSSVAHRRYELAYPLYLSAAQGFLWACRYVRQAGIVEPSTSAGEGSACDGDRIAKLRDNFMRQAKRAMDRADKIREVKGAEWARRWGGAAARDSRSVFSVEAQSKVLAQSSAINGLSFEPWLQAEDASRNGSHPPPNLSPKQMEAGAALYSARKRADKVLMVDPKYPLRGAHITQDAVTNCGLVAALEVLAEHDQRWQTKLLNSPLESGSGCCEILPAGQYNVCLHLNGCLRTVIVDDGLPFYETSDGGHAQNNGRSLICASVDHPDGALILMPSLIEKAYLTVLRTYAPAGSLPAEDLNVLTGWLPEVIQLPDLIANARSKSLPSPPFQRERAWQRVYQGWTQGVLLICAGTSGGASGEVAAADMVPPAQDNSVSELVPGHTYAVLSMAVKDDERILHLMNPWRPATTAKQRSNTTAATFQLSWDQFCVRFSSIHLAWNPEKLFSHVSEVHGKWAKEVYADADEVSAGHEAPPTTIRNVELSLTVKQDLASVKKRSDEGSDEVWLHLIRHLGAHHETGKTVGKQYIALHIFEANQGCASGPRGPIDEVRILPIGADRIGSSDYVDSAHHLVRFKPASLSSSGEPDELPAQNMEKHYNITVSLHVPRLNADQDVNFTLRAWSRYDVSINDAGYSDPDGTADSWSCKVNGSWTAGSSAGGHLLCPTFHQNPQYIITVPPATPKCTLSLTLQAASPMPCHILVAHSPHTSSGTSRPVRLDKVESANVVADSGAYIQGLTKARCTLPATVPGEAARYVVLLSSYHAGQEGDFQLTLECRQRQIIASTRPLVTAAGRPTSNQGANRGYAEEDPLMVNPMLPEGAGLYGKIIRGSWSVADGTAAGAPRRGNYKRNPAWLLYLNEEGEAHDSKRDAGVRHPHTVARQTKPAKSRATFRLTAFDSRATPDAQDDEQDQKQEPLRLPAINLSLFASKTGGKATSEEALELGDELYTTGPYTVSPCGIALPEVKVPLAPLSSSSSSSAPLVLVASTFEEMAEADFTLQGWCDERSWAWRRVR